MIVALDLFAGTGWGVACRWLGIKEYGVEIMPEACETRRLNGMETVFNDVWDGLNGNAEVPNYHLLIASPPCQTFSLAGNGAGRKALTEVMGLINSGKYRDPEALKEFGDTHDPRTALVLAPLAYIARDLPTYVALEQVPTVLPVWQGYAHAMREMGYSVAVGNIQAEQYGVPQTRKRAILVARRDGKRASLPKPTHSKYYPRDPERLDEGVLPWVSMAEALGWGMTHRPYLTVTGGGDKDSSKKLGDPAPSALGSKASRERVAAEREAGRFVFPEDEDRQLMTPSGELKLLADELGRLQSYPPSEVTFTANNRLAHASHRPMDKPAPTITGGHDSTNRGYYDPDGEFRMASTEDVAALQSYPKFLRSNYNTGDTGERGERSTDAPSSTVTSKAGFGKWDGERNMEPDEAAILQSYPAEGLRPEVADWKWVDAPATTVTGRPFITAREHHYHGDQGRTSLRLEEGEAHQLQSFPPFVWAGSRAKVFLQIGNAVPPVMARAVLETFL